MSKALDVMLREKRRYSVISEVAKALDEIAALEADARKQAELIIAEAESKAAQIVAKALNEAKAMTDEVKARLETVEAIPAHVAEINEMKPTVKPTVKPIVFPAVSHSILSEPLY